MSTINTQQFSRKNLNVPVLEPIPGSTQKLNNTGGYAWQINDWDRLDRFLILGSDSTYYVGEKDLTKQSYECVNRLLKEDGLRVVRTIVDVSTNGRAYKNDPALFALALAANADSVDVRRAALAALPKVARIGTHLYHFAQYVTSIRGTGRAVRNALANWFASKTPEQLAHQLTKYQQRDGWSARDLLRIAHPRPVDAGQEAVYRWVVSGMNGLGRRTVIKKQNGFENVATYESVEKYLPKFIQAFEEAKTADEKKLIALIIEHNLPRECVPTDKLNSAAVWEALLEKMPMTAMIRNLGKMSAVGLLKPLSNASKKIVTALADEKMLQKSRIHPLQILVANKIYSQGHGDKGSLEWTTVSSILSALDAAFYKTFQNVAPCGKPLLIALDVSGSMGSSLAGIPALSCCEGTAALSLIHANVEPECHVFGFADSFRELGIRKGMTLQQATQAAQDNNFGSTNVGLAIEYAIKHKLQVGGFVVMTDNECNTGDHMALRLKDYRNKFVQDARCVMVGMTATDVSCNDPQDKYGLDIAGFDTSTPAAIADFIRGNTEQKLGGAIEE